MRIFLSYASEYRDAADSIAVGLQQDGNEVFFDREDLQAGEGFDARIRAEIQRADLFIFLIAPESVESGAYTLTELGFARQRWANPVGSVLPVMIAATPMERVPPYLRSVNILKAEGNVVAEVRAAVLNRPKARRIPRAVAAVLLGLAVVLGAWWFASTRSVVAVVNGTLRDPTTDGPIVGATVEVYSGTEKLGFDKSDSSGRFRVELEMAESAEPRSTQLLISHEDFVERSADVVIAPGQTEHESYSLDLLPRELSRCVLEGGHAVVVGHFRWPNDLPFRDLTSRIAEALTYSLHTRLQQQHLPVHYQPRVFACKEAEPRDVNRAGNIARALRADAFLTGDVLRENGAYTVSAQVSDRFELFVPPRRSESRGVSLEIPGAAQLDPSTHADVLTAVAKGYEEEGKYAECVEVTVAAERILGSLGPAIQQRRESCQARTANHALLNEGAP